MAKISQRKQCLCDLVVVGSSLRSEHGIEDRCLVETIQMDKHCLQQSAGQQSCCDDPPAALLGSQRASGAPSRTASLWLIQYEVDFGQAKRMHFWVTNDVATDLEISGKDDFEIEHCAVEMAGLWVTAAGNCVHRAGSAVSFVELVLLGYSGTGAPVAYAAGASELVHRELDGDLFAMSLVVEAHERVLVMTSGAVSEHQEGWMLKVVERETKPYPRVLAAADHAEASTTLLMMWALGLRTS